MTDQPPGHDYRTPVDPDVKATLQGIGSIVGAAMPEGYGFALLIFSFGENGTMAWLSNAQRADMLKAMSEFIAKQANA